jgi:MFS family permease
LGKRWTWVAWSMLALFAIGVTALCVLAVATGNIHQVPTDNVALLLAFTAFMVVGALIVAHRPGNPVGWILSAIGLLSVTGASAEEYAFYAYVTRPGAVPGAIVAAWYAGWHWNLTISLTLVFTALLFPTGRLASPRWRPLAWLAGLTTAALVLLGALQASLPEIGGRVLPNPIGITGIGNPEQSRVGDVLFALLIVLAVAAFASLAFRFRHARGDERQQLKWFTYAAALLPLVVLGGLLPDTVGNLFFALVIAFLPVAAGIAILRYRLYDIDRLINRTLVYGLLTVVLGAVYAGLVLALGQLFGGIGSETPSWAVAGATLVVATLFQPARHRIQAAVDRRFNRRKYDAAKTVEAFSARLRDELDLDTLAAELVAVVDQTIQPTQASLWLRPSTNGRSRPESEQARPRSAPVVAPPAEDGRRRRPPAGPALSS